MNNKNIKNGQLQFKKSAIAVASALALMSLSGHATTDADSSANAGPLGAAAAAATAYDNASAGTSNATTSNPSASATATGITIYGSDRDDDGAAAAAATGLVDDGVGATAISEIVTNIEDGVDNILSSSANASEEIDVDANRDNVNNGVEDTTYDSDYRSFAGALVTEARSSLENKTVNNSSSAPIQLTSDSISSAEVYIDTYDYDIQNTNANAQAASAAASASYANSLVNNNTVSNTGRIENLTGNGILLGASSDAYAEADAEATADAIDSDQGDESYDFDIARADAESYAESLIQSNTINNSGSVSASDAAIAILAESDANSYATAEARNASIDADSWAVSKILQNTINNNGTLNGRTGILLFSDAYAYDSETDNSTALANVNNNTLINHGTINGEDAGVLLRVLSDIGGVNNAVGDATSTLDTNTLINFGNILVEDGAGVELLAQSTGGSEALSYIRTNTITNSGLISAGNVGEDSDVTIVATGSYDSASNTDGGGAGLGSDGIRFRAVANESAIDFRNLDRAEVSGNTINNTGKIYAMDDGIEISASDGADIGWFGGRVLPGNEIYEILEEGDILNYGNAVVLNNTINNTYGGRIVAGDVGINISADYVQRNVINNSGLIVSDPGMSLNGANLTKSDPASWQANNANAIRFAGWADDEIDRSGNVGFDNVLENGTQNFLNLSAPGYLAGRIMLRAESDVNVTLTSGVSHSVRWAIQNDNDYVQENQSNAYTWAGGAMTRAVLNGPNPWFVNEGLEDVNGRRNDVYATIDPSAFSAAANMLADLSGMVSTMAKTGMNQTGEKNGVWIAANGTRMDYDGDKRATMDQDTRVMGGSIGYTHHFDGFKAGVMAGYSDAELQVGSFYRDLYRHSYDNDTRGGFAGIYGNTDIGWLNVNVGLSGGRLNHDDKRFVNDNLKWWGISYAKADYDSTWYSPEVTLSVPFEAGEGFTITPNLHLQYTKQNIDSYTEKGSDSNARVASRDIAVSEAKVGLDVSKTVGMARFMGRVGYLNRNSHGDNSVRVTMIGDTQDVPFFYQDINAVYVGAGVNINLGDRVDFNLSGNYLTGKDFDNGGNVTGMLRFKY